MKVTSQQVKALQKRIDVTYEEAEKFINKSNGNLDEAEKLVRAQRETMLYKWMTEIQRLIKELLTYHIKITTGDKEVVNLPLAIVFGLFMIMAVDTKIWVAVISMGLILVSESVVSVDRVEKDTNRIIQKDGHEHSTHKDEDVGEEEQEQEHGTAHETAQAPMAEATVSESYIVDDIDNRELKGEKETRVEPVINRVADVAQEENTLEDEEGYYEITIE